MATLSGEDCGSVELMRGAGYVRPSMRSTGWGSGGFAAAPPPQHRLGRLTLEHPHARGDDDVDALVVAARVHRGHEEALARGAVGQRVAADQLAVGKLDGDLPAVRALGRSAGEGGHVDAVRISLQVPDEE